MNAADAPLSDLYRELVLEHKRAPRHWGALERPTHQSHGHSPQCGDDLTLQLRVHDGRIEDLRYHGQGCAICIASASMMSEAVAGQSVEHAQALHEHFRAVLTGQREPEERTLGKLVSLAGVRRSPNRIKCALLAWHALAHALAEGDAPEAASMQPPTAQVVVPEPAR